jgi:hypothetical protein
MRFVKLLGAMGLISAALCCGQTQQQTLPNGWMTVDPTGSSAWPFNQATDHKWQFHYDSSQFVATGPVTITDIAFRAATPTTTVAAFSFPSVVITMASSPTNYSVAPTATQPGHSPTFANNLNPDATVVRTGPWSGGPVPPSGGTTATWIPLGLTGTFTYDPTLGLDFVLQIEKCGNTSLWAASIDGPSGAAGTIFGNRYGSGSSCTATMSTLQNNEFVPVVRIDYILGGGGPAEWQVNQPGSSLDVNGIIGSAFAPATVNLGIGVTGFANLSSVNTGLVWDVGVGVLPLVPRSAGALTTIDGQVLNLNVADPAFLLLWGGFASPPFVNASLPLVFGSPTTLSFQMAVASPVSPSGLLLSQPVRLLVP